MANEPTYTTACGGCISLPVSLKFQVWDLASPPGYYRDYVDGDFASPCAACLTPAVGSTTWDGTVSLVTDGGKNAHSCFYRPLVRVHSVGNRQVLLLNDILLHRSNDDNDPATDAWERGFCDTNAGIWILRVTCHEADDCTDRTFPSHVIFKAHCPERSPANGIFSYVQGCTDSIPRGRMVAI